jgi:Ca-activated chloride channel family protein
MFVLLLVVGLGFANPIRSAICTDVLVASSNEKYDLMSNLAADYSAEHRIPGCPPVVSVEKVASGDAESYLERDWSGTDVPRPDVWAPAASTWVQLLAQSRPDLVPNSPYPSIATSPLVVAMPKDVFTGLGGRAVQRGWADIAGLRADGTGQPFRLGKTQPQVSTSGLNSLIAMYNAASLKLGLAPFGVDVSSETGAVTADAQAVAFVKATEQAVSHYGDTIDTIFQNLAAFDCANLPDAYLSAIAVEEQEVYQYNQGAFRKQGCRLPRPLYAIYPRDGTLVADHPFVVLHESWVSPQKSDAALAFVRWLQEPAQQTRFKARGFRGADGSAGATLAAPEFVPGGPTATIAVPPPPAVAAIVDSWKSVRKRARILVVLDVHRPIQRAAILQAFHNLVPQDEIAVWSVAPTRGNPPYRVLAPFGPAGRTDVETAMTMTSPSGAGPLYGTIAAGADALEGADDLTRIKAILVIADTPNDGEPPLAGGLEDKLRGSAGEPLIHVYVVALPHSDPHELGDIATVSGGSDLSTGSVNDAVKRLLGDF